LTKEEFIENVYTRLKAIALRCIPICEILSKKSDYSRNISFQLAKSSSSAAANYRAVRRSRSKNEFFAKLSIVIEELDETEFWITFACEANFLEQIKYQEILNETN
jgi:four helix bundle protein